jgi:hypothetical protein
VRSDEGAFEYVAVLDDFLKNETDFNRFKVDRSVDVIDSGWDQEF